MARRVRALLPPPSPPPPPPPPPEQPEYLRELAPWPTPLPEHPVYSTGEEVQSPAIAPQVVVDPSAPWQFRALQLALSSSQFWVSPTTWNDCYTTYHRYLLGALMLKMATVGGGALTSFAESIGATVTVLEDLSPLAPNGAIFKFPTAVVFVIPGATRREQLVFLRDGDTHSFYYVTPTGISTTPMVSAQSPVILIDKITEIGTPYNRFVDLANPWIDAIKDWYAANWNGEKLFLFGHSLGAAVCELAASYFGVWRRNCIFNPQNIGSIRPEDGLAYLTSIGNKMPLEVDGGAVFGQPYVFWEDRTVPIESNRRADCVPGFRYQMARLARYDHPYDPVVYMPYHPAWYVFAGNALRFRLVRRNPAKFTRHFFLRDEHKGSAWITAAPNLIAPPSSYAVLKERCQLYHGIDRYISHLRAGFEQKCGPAASAWSELIDGVTGATSSATFDWE